LFYDGFNNYYTPKIYDLSDTNLSDILVWFKDAYGNKIPIRDAYTISGDILNEIYQAVFKIECELAIL
jgi:hypothetical protein